MFEPFGVIFRLIKYGIIQGTSVWLPTGSHGLQYDSYKIWYLKNLELLYWHNGLENPKFRILYIV